MNVIDFSAWLEYFADGPNAAAFEPAIRDVARLVVPTVCLFEVFKRIAQQKNVESALVAMAALHQGTILPLDAGLAMEAAQLSLKKRLPMADSIVLATANRFAATLWTQDSDFASIENERATIRYFQKR